MPADFQDSFSGRFYKGETVTSQQQYALLLQEHMDLGHDIDKITAARAVLRSDMDALAKFFPDTFYYPVLHEQLLHRAFKQHTIELRKFDT